MIMKVLLVNGGPHEKGCTYTALKEVEKTLKAGGIETEIFWLGKEPVRGCTGCRGCAETDGKCVFNDVVNVLIDKAKTADGFVFGSPVHYASPSGNISSVLDRAFFAGSRFFKYKPGAAVVSCRRGGSTSAFDVLNKYFTISSMPVVSSCYWNMVHGNTPEQVLADEEGVRIMNTLGTNMAWLLNSLAAAKEAGVEHP